MCVCVARAVIDVMMIAKLARGVFACVARDEVITSRHFVSREWITHASSTVRTKSRRSLTISHSNTSLLGFGQKSLLTSLVGSIGVSLYAC